MGSRALLLVVLLAACTAREGARCRRGATCDGARALVCIDHRWVAERCKTACSTSKHGLECDVPDDPRPGEGCYDWHADEGYTSSPTQTRCSADGKSLLRCRPPDGLWTERACDRGQQCERSRCVSAAAPVPVVGQPFFVGGVQVELCEAGGTPMPLDRSSSLIACWYQGTSCAGHGTQIDKPFSLAGNVVAGSTTHSGCDLGTFSLVYERGTSPLRLRVCESRGAPVDCPAMVNDGASWDITSLLEANHATNAKLLAPPPPRLP